MRCKCFYKPRLRQLQNSLSTIFNKCETFTKIYDDITFSYFRHPVSEHFYRRTLCSEKVRHTIIWAAKITRWKCDTSYWVKNKRMDRISWPMHLKCSIFYVFAYYKMLSFLASLPKSTSFGVLRISVFGCIIPLLAKPKITMIFYKWPIFLGLSNRLLWYCIKVLKIIWLT